MINILIRTAGRPEFTRCLDSIRNQTYKDVHLIVSVDRDDYQPEIDLPHEIVKVKKGSSPFYWNLYCNDLKERVQKGWFFYLDDDDFLVDKHCLKQISTHLINPYHAVICQFNRGAKAKPNYNYAFEMKPDHIVRGKIGGSCIFLHHIKKDVANWDGNRAADYRFIKSVSEKMPMVFVPIVVVQAGNNGRHGK